MSKVARAKIAEMASIYKLLSDETRLYVIDMLFRSRTPLSVGEIAESIQMSHSATSHLLGSLFRNGVVENLRDGREKLYTIGKTIQAKRVMKILKNSN